MPRVHTRCECLHRRAHSSTVTLWRRCADVQPGLTGVARHGGFPVGGISKILSIVSRAVWQ